MRKPTFNGTVQKAVKTATRAEQVVLRTPLAVLDQQVLAHVPGSAKVRAVVGRGISALDSVAGRASQLGTSGSSESTGAPEPTGSAAPTPLEEIPVEEVEERAAHLLEQQEQQPLAGELAEDDELRRVQAELKAKHAVEAEHEARQ
jgi:hypothetical protein